MELKEWLQSYWELWQEEQRLENRVAMLDSKCRKVTASYTGMPSGSGSAHNSTWDVMIQAKEEAATRLAEVLRRQKEIEELIDSVAKPAHREVLRLRYVEMLTHVEVAERIGLSERRERGICKEALREAEEIWNRRNGL